MHSVRVLFLRSSSQGFSRCRVFDEQNKSHASFLTFNLKKRLNSETYKRIGGEFMKIAKLIQALFFLLVTTLSYAQTITTVTNEKVGKLSSIIKKKNVLNISRLKISGTMNNEDFAYLGSMNNLEYLDLKDVNLSNDKEKDNKKEFTSYNQLTLPVLAHLKELWLPLSCRGFYPYKCNTPNIPVLDVLHIRRGCEIITYSNDREKIHLKKINILENDLTKINLGKFRDTPQNISQGELDWLIGREHRTSKYYEQTGFYNIKDEYIHNLKQKIFVDSLVVPTADCLIKDCLPLKEIFPNYIFINKDNLVILNRWNDKYNINDIVSIDSIVPFAFANSHITTINIPKKIKHIPDFCFTNCKKLKKVILNESIISIGKNAFSKCAIKDIEIPQSVTNLYFSAFETCPIEKIIFLSPNPPHINDQVINVFDNGYIYLTDSWVNRENYSLGWDFTYKMIVPKNAITAYHSQELWNEMNLIEKDAQSSFNITVEEPGNILSSLPLKNLNSIDSLIITGFLYETDLNIIKKCRFLSYLDLSHTYITYSPKFLKQEQADTEALNFLFGLLGKGLDHESRDKKISTNEYQANKALAYVLQSATEFNEPENNCCIPYNALEGMALLKTVKLPLRAACIYREAFKNCKSLETIEFSPYLRTIVFSAFEDCMSLKKIRLPQSVERIGEKTFYRCMSLEQIELPQKLKKLGNNTFKDCINLKELIFPEGLMEIPSGCISGCYKMNKVVIPKSVIKIGSDNNRYVRLRLPEGEYFEKYPDAADFYFKSSTPPIIEGNNMIHYGGKVHIPKGSITAYYNMMGNKVEYIEE